MAKQKRIQWKLESFGHWRDPTRYRYSGKRVQIRIKERYIYTLEKANEFAEGLEDAGFEIAEEYDCHYIEFYGWRDVTDEEREEYENHKEERKATMAQMKEQQLAQARKLLEDAGEIP
ncbi:MAG TPA: hypothetical protein VJ742_13075 [Nitrososphaera sp.]|nr:hypothetical protein [Nitrososphaera sp.]